MSIIIRILIIFFAEKLLITVLEYTSQCSIVPVQGGQKLAHSLVQSPGFEKLQFVSFVARQPLPCCQAAECLCGLMGGMAGLCWEEKPNWSVFSTVAKSCHHNKVRPRSCCCRPTKYTTERFRQIHRHTNKPSLSIHFVNAVSTFSSVYSPTIPFLHLLCFMDCLNAVAGSGLSLVLADHSEPLSFVKGHLRTQTMLFARTHTEVTLINVNTCKRTIGWFGVWNAWGASNAQYSKSFKSSWKKKKHSSKVKPTKTVKHRLLVSLRSIALPHWDSELWIVSCFLTVCQCMLMLCLW